MLTQSVRNSLIYKYLFYFKVYIYKAVGTVGTVGTKMVPMFPRKSIIQARKSAILPGKSRLFFQILEKHKNTGLDNYKKPPQHKTKRHL